MNPFRNLPPVRLKHFKAPAPEFLKKLADDAENELRHDPVRAKDYVLFRLACRLGGRTQELIHLRWADVRATGVYIVPRKTKYGRFMKLRDHGESDELLDFLEPLRRANGDYVIEDGECSIRRGLHIERRLVGWLREKIAAAGLGEVNQGIHWLRQCVATDIERKHGALARATVMGTNISAGAKNEPGVIAAAAALGHSPEVSARHYIGKTTAIIRAASAR